MRQTTLYRHFDSDENLLYVGISSRPWKRMVEHKVSCWYDKIHNITLQHYESREEAIKAEREAITEENPIFNIQRYQTIKKQNEKEKQIIDNSRLNHISSIVHYRVSYSIKEVREMTGLRAMDIKELLEKDLLSYYEVSWRVDHKIKRIPGWSVIDLIEHLTDRGKK